MVYGNFFNAVFFFQHNLKYKNYHLHDEKDLVEQCCLLHFTLF